MLTDLTTNTVVLPHLRPTIALDWLKSIGLVRLTGCRGFWKGAYFHLETDSEETIIENLIEKYQPKPFASPWNKKSIFRGNKGLQQEVLASQSGRYALVRDGYRKIKVALENLDIQDKSSKDSKLIMKDLVGQVDSSYWLEWSHAVGLLTQTRKGPRFLCNDLLGTGGNVMTTDFCTVYLQMCMKLWDLDTGEPAENTESYIRASILGETIGETLLQEGILGHTYPAADFFDDLAPSKGSQADYLDNGGRSSQLANPIDLILYLEGATTFTGKKIPLNEISREGDQEFTLAAYPLLLEVNSGSADTSDRTGRSYEVWLPLWEEPMDWEDFQDMVVNDLAFRLKNQIRDTIDMLDVITQVDEYRGLSRFSRFGLWKRKGKGNYLIHMGLATPGRSDYGAELRKWRFEASPVNVDDHSHSQYNLLVAIQKALYQLQQGNAEAETVICLLGQLEILHSRIKPKKISPVPQLQTGWVEAVYQKTPIPEVELAIALASTKLTHRDTGQFYSLRRLLSAARHAHESETWFWSRDHTHKLKTSSLEQLCLSLLKLWNEDLNYHPCFGWTHWASPDAIASFIAGHTNDQLILELAIGFSLCRLPASLDPYSRQQPLPDPYTYAASLQWSRETHLTTQTIHGLLTGSTVPLCRQLAAVQKPVVLPQRIAVGRRCALALVFPCRPFHSFGDPDAERDHS